ncbi:hypothetical protein AGR6A_pb0031 [Agrobacterium sp. NCPPB 925]|nr:hypothetical protein AGR6A_pb0031 [Agrobacterium sp. NCPPB 925]
MPAHIEHYKNHRIAIYSPGDHFAVVTPPGGNAVMSFPAGRPEASRLEGPEVCLERAKAAIDELLGSSRKRPAH